MFDATYQTPSLFSSLNVQDVQIAKDRVTLYRKKKDTLKDSKYFYDRVCSWRETGSDLEVKMLSRNDWEHEIDIEIAQLEDRINEGYCYLERLQAEIDKCAFSFLYGLGLGAYVYVP
ncbi:hypothetical protein GOP47_0015767 [Adiantum capillus-veneris]|uniref:Uncharacterized protein n=1 Tax=Adiantum capillus-veneris TaxID=13818 RepID=A0A9D4UL76_ADICA|nr:hypothetical protein GOP47_0015767 [Adiantum capillus-veneris]